MDLLLEEYDRVLQITLNRAAKRNALNMQMCADIVATVGGAEARDDIGCVLITAQAGVFCAGMDLHENAAADALAQVHEQLFTLGARAVKPILVAVGGAALAGGLGLAAQGHIVLAAREATFSLPEVRIGLWPFVVFRAVEAAFGRRKALELSLTGATFGAEEAQAWGLVHEIHAAADLHERARRVAREVAAASPAAIAAGMQYVRDSAGKALHEAGVIAGELRGKLMATDDYKEGTAAFKERREPRWPSIPLEFYAKRSGSADRS